MALLIIGRPDQRGSTGRDNRMFVEGVLGIVRIGSPRRALPDAFGERNSVFRRFSRWSRKGVWWRIFAAMSDDPDFEDPIVDANIVRAHRHAAGAKRKRPGDQASSDPVPDQALGRSRGGLSIKIHPVVRGLGSPVRFALTAGQKGDAPQAEVLSKNLPANVVLADAAYDSDRLRKRVAGKDAQAVIPNNPSRARKHDLDKERHLLTACCLAKLKQFRRVATRYAKTAQNYAAVVILAAIVLWRR